MTSTERACHDCGISFSAKHARYCVDCRWKHRRKRTKYVWTPERDEYLRNNYRPNMHGRTKEIAARWGWPLWAVRHRAVRLGLSIPKPSTWAWTKEQEAFLWTHCGTRPLTWMWRHLPEPRRTQAAIALKIKRMKLRRRVTEGYTLRELCLCFGQDHKVISKWIEDGKLKSKRGTAYGPNRRLVVSDADLLSFIAAHPMAFDLRKVEQRWFMDLILDGALVRKALESIRRDDTEEAA